MRRIWSAYVVTIVLAGAVTLAGCAGQGDGGGGSADQPQASPTASTPATAPDVIGTVTKADGNMILVEEQPGVAERGRKVWVGLANADTDAEPAQLVGKRVKVWLTGPCAESYPEQCTGVSVELA